MKRTLVLAVLLLLALLLFSVGCSTATPSVDVQTFVIVDRLTGTRYSSDLEPKPKVSGSTITFVQGGEAYMLNGGWLIVGELRESK